MILNLQNKNEKQELMFKAHTLLPTQHQRECRIQFVSTEAWLFLCEEENRSKSTLQILSQTCFIKKKIVLPYWSRAGLHKNALQLQVVTSEEHDLTHSFLQDCTKYLLTWVYKILPHFFASWLSRIKEKSRQATAAPQQSQAVWCCTGISFFFSCNWNIMPRNHLTVIW